jgi:hypothetical protein
MTCKKCGGRMFLERMFSENKNFETSCLVCGARNFIDKGSKLGQWLDKKEQAFRRAAVLPH